MSMISVNDAAALVGRHRSTISRAFLSGRLKGIRYPDGSYQVDEDDVLHVYGNYEPVKTGYEPHWGDEFDDYWTPEMAAEVTKKENEEFIAEQIRIHSAPGYGIGMDDVPGFGPRPHDETEDWYRVLYWGDTHISPGDNYDRIRWIANYVKFSKPDHVWHGGDLATFDSCSAHDPIGSRKDKAKPTIKQDMDCLATALAVYHEELGETTIPHDFSEGNHEYRVKRFEDSLGVMEESLYPQLRQTFYDHGWNYHNYGQMMFLEGVGFVHVPFARNGKPYASHAVMLRDMTYDIVFGHTHAFHKITQPKIGQQNKVTLLNGGCTLPYNHVEDYAKLNPTGWEYGVVELSVYQGQIKDTSFISLPTLQRIYNANRKTH